MKSSFDTAENALQLRVVGFGLYLISGTLLNLEIKVDSIAYQKHL